MQVHFLHSAVLFVQGLINLRDYWISNISFGMTTALLHQEIVDRFIPQNWPHRLEGLRDALIANSHLENYFAKWRGVPLWTISSVLPSETAEAEINFMGGGAEILENFKKMPIIRLRKPLYF